MMNLLVIILVISVMTVTGQTNFHNVQSQIWVTKILSDTLSDYIPDGEMVCKRHGLEYWEGLKDLKLWATQSKFIVKIKLLRDSILNNFWLKNNITIKKTSGNTP